VIGPDSIPLVPIVEALSNVSALDTAAGERCLSCILMLAAGGGENDSSSPLCRLPLLAAAGDDPPNDMEAGLQFSQVYACPI
jgi:hypothetical protein